MIYLFIISIIFTFIKQKDKLLKQKRNLFLYLLLSTIGITLGLVYIINPYLPSMSSMLEKYMK